MIKDKEEKVMQWASFTDKDNSLAVETFDLLEFKYSMPDLKPNDAEYKERNKKLLNLTAKKENRPTINYFKGHPTGNQLFCDLTSKNAQLSN